MRKTILVGFASLFASTLAFAQGGASFQKLDEDGDKNISQQEAQVEQDLSTNFNQWDQDSDGVLTQDEFKAYQAAEQAERKGGGGGGGQQQKQ